MDRFAYLIIGGGLAGGSAAESIRQRDATGRLALVSAEPHLPYDRVPLSKTYLMGRMKRERLFLKKPEFYEEQKVELMTERRVDAIDIHSRTVRLDDGRELGFEKLLLATGGRPRRLSLPGSELAGIYYLRTIEDCEAIREAMGRSGRAVVIGGGFIGCEVAAAFAAQGLETTLLELGPYLLNMALDEETGRWIGDYFTQQGVRVMLDAAAARFLGEAGQVRAVETRDGQRIECDFVAVGIGIALNTELAQRSGLKIDNGVIVDKHLETEIPGLYAAGDIARFYSPPFGRHLRVEHYDVAVKHGQVAGANMAEERLAFEELPYFFSYQFKLNINVFGDMSHWDQMVRRGRLSVDPGFLQFYFEGHRLNAVLSVNRKAAELQAAQRLIAARRPGEQPALLADESIDLEHIALGLSEQGRTRG
ncbi:MAG: FAD-dependent oxidoreductase [Chloroflexi bacterium]|nr:FAD-dependent oxidoreductase [Chloroflexota bacterium]